MREIRRQIARHLMEMHGVEQINRKKYQEKRSKAGQAKPDSVRKVSFFALHWREYLEPGIRLQEGPGAAAETPGGAAEPRRRKAIDSTVAGAEEIGQFDFGRQGTGVRFPPVRGWRPGDLLIL